MRKGAVLAALLLASCNAERRAPQIAIEDAWARATVAQQPSSAAYFTIVNSGGDDRLVSVSSPAAEASLHSTTMDQGVMRMRPLDALDVPANAAVKLEPGATHVMLTGLDRPLQAGATIPLQLRFERSGERQVELGVLSASGEAM